MVKSTTNLQRDDKNLEGHINQTTQTNEQTKHQLIRKDIIALEANSMTAEHNEVENCTIIWGKYMKNDGPVMFFFFLTLVLHYKREELFSGYSDNLHRLSKFRLGKGKQLFYCHSCSRGTMHTGGRRNRLHGHRCRLAWISNP